jgi:1-acyl-sn-glycerol-3-phosphate acyltransferase
MTPMRVPYAMRVARAARASAHVLAGLSTVLVRFPRLALRAREARIRTWSARLLRILGVQRRVSGDAAALARPGRLLVANHVSWLDIFVIDAIHPACFVAKSEIRRWPVAGTLAARVGTLFIERGRRRDTHRVNGAIRAALDAGQLVGVFPESTTTDGSRLLHFHGSLLQAIADGGGALIPVAIRYSDAAGGRSDAAAYAGDTGFLESFWRIAGERRTVAEIVVLPEIPAGGANRRDLARAAESAIRTALGLPGPERRPGRPHDPRDEPR